MYIHIHKSYLTSSAGRRDRAQGRRRAPRGREQERGLRYNMI